MSDRMQPLRLEVELGGLAVVPDRHPPLLDALLLALQGVRRPLPFQRDNLPVTTIAGTDWPAADFVWLASAVYIEWTGPATDRFLHRNAQPFDALADASDHGTTTVDLGKGLTKVARTRFAVRQAVAARAWCIGDPGALNALLGRFTSLGAHRHLGYGLVRSARWVPDPDAKVLSWYRPLPAPHPKDPYRAQRYHAAGRATPPYWDRDLGHAAWWPRPE